MKRKQHKENTLSARCERTWNGLDLHINKNFSLRAAARICGLSHTTLSHRHREYISLPESQRPQSLEAYRKIYKSPGRPTTFSRDFEDLLVQRLVFLTKRGTPITCKRASNQIALFLSDNPETNHRFHGTRGPGKKWWKRLMHDYPILS